MPILHITIEANVSGRLNRDVLADMADAALEAVESYESDKVRVNASHRFWNLTERQRRIGLMALDLEPLRAWAQAVVDQLPPDSESYGRAVTTLAIIEWNEQVVNVLDRLLAQWNDA